MDAHTTLQMSKHTDVQYTSRAHTHKKLPGPKRGAKVFSVKLPHLRKSRDKVYLKIEGTIYKPLPGGQFSNMNLDLRSLTKAIHVLKYIHVSPRNTIRYDKVWARRRVITALLTKKKWKITYMLSKWRYFKLIVTQWTLCHHKDA